MLASPIIAANGASFPDNQFLPPRDLAPTYSAAVKRGLAAMKRSRTVICGLARNVANYLPVTIARLEQLGSLFADYRVLIY